MKVVIFCGGSGTRLREETEYIPKPMVKIGKYPIIWHIMKLYSHYGHSDFVLPLGYKGDVIKEYFKNYLWLSNDFTVNSKNNEIEVHGKDIEDWNITLADTGLKTQTAQRLYKVKNYIVPKQKNLDDDDLFMLTYGDGVADVDINALLDFHKKKGKLITITGINPLSQYGIIDIDSNNIAKNFCEKPGCDDIINGGFMVFDKKIFDYIESDGDYMLVKKTIPELAKKGEVAIYRHEGFWHCMDTYRDYLKLNKMWENNDRPWAIWDK